MPSDTAATWNRLSDGGRGGVLPSVDAVVYGPDIGTEAEFRLLGNVAGKRVLELGCGAGINVVAMARQGAHAIGLDFAAEQLAAARRLAEQEEVKVELHTGDLAELVFLRAESIDVALSAYALGLVDDLNRVFRQVHRVLKQGSPFVFSLPHPSSHLIDDDDPEQPLLIRRSYFDRSTVNYDWEGLPLSAHHHTFSDLFTGLSRANFSVDTVLEPEPGGDGRRSAHWRDAYDLVPRTLVIRARKQGN
ncbi:MAG: class I SAM-dependent methyltransferase [Actinomycetota bacterium]|nr:class I SAM-dependent methyltransferase [Actinomycetota bacterium]